LPVPAFSVVGPLPPKSKSQLPVPPFRTAVPLPTTDNSESPPFAVSVMLAAPDVSI